MDGRTSATRIALVAALAAAAFGLASEQAQAAYSARVEAGTLTFKGDAAGDTLVLRLQPGSPGTLQADLGADGTADFSFDRSTFTAVEVNAGGGDDEIRIDQSGGAFTDENVTMNGGNGDDTMIGGAGSETFVGGSGEDFADGNTGADQASLGGGNDRYQWDPGDASDTVEGQGGSDVLDFNASNASEQFAFTAGPGGAVLTRNVGNVTMALSGLERVDLSTLGGTDVATVDDLGGTGLKLVDIDLGAGDGVADVVVARGCEEADKVSFASPDGRPVVNGLGAQVRVTGGEAALDSVVAALLGGPDTATMTVGVASPIPLRVDGGEGEDTARYNGSDDADQISILPNAGETAIANSGSGLFQLAAVESTTVAGQDGNDMIVAFNGIGGLTALTLEGGNGEDDLRGANGADTLNGGPGNDSVDGNTGADQAFLGSGDDRYQWDPGDASDTVEGQGGTDRLDFNASNAGEQIELTANAGRGRLTRNIGNVTMDFDGIERVAVRMLGGADIVAVNDLAGTDVDDVDVNLRASDGAGDGQTDTVVARGTEAADRIALSSPGGYPLVSGLHAAVLVDGAEAAFDDVNVEALGGDDTITSGREVLGPASYNVDGGEGADVTRYSGTDVDDAIDVVANGAEVSTVALLAARLDTTAVESLVLLGLAGADTISAVGNLAALTTLTMDGGEDNDTLRGGNGADILSGGPGADNVDGNPGADQAFLGSGDDRYQWDPGDASDTVEGQSGIDTLDFNASNAGEQIELTADAGRVRITRNIGNVTMDLDGIEQAAIRLLGGTDTTTVGDLSGTNLKTVDVDLGGSAGGGDGATDTVVVNGTDRRDVVQVARSGDQVVVAGLAAAIAIAGSEGLNDTLRIQTLGGNDDVTVAPDAELLITPVIDLGAGE